MLAKRTSEHGEKEGESIPGAVQEVVCLLKGKKRHQRVSWVFKHSLTLSGLGLAEKNENDLSTS